MITVNYNVQILFVLCFFKVSCTKVNIGDSCKLKNETPGICKYLTNCVPALKIIHGGGFPTDICISEGTQFIVCCEDTSQVTEPPTTKPEIRKEIPSPTIVNKTANSNRKAGEISNIKCKEYANYVWDTSLSPTFSIVPHRSNTFECPFEKLPLIVGGTLASRQEFPHMALIGYNKGQEVEWSCGGSLISENYVLTASHCLYHSRMGLAKLVRVGMTNQSDTANLQELTITEVRYHPKYKPPSKYNDIALLKLSGNVELNTHVRPACLQTENEIPYKKAIVTGWGNIGYSGDASNDLLKVVLEFFDQPFCNHTYRRKVSRSDEIKLGILGETMVCAGSHDSIKDTCQGDSGGPLQVYRQSSDNVTCMYNIVGVTSFGKACGLAKNAPGVYTRVSAYIKWIEDIVWPESL